MLNGHDTHTKLQIAHAARATWRACEASARHAPVVDESMARWLAGVVDGLHMLCDTLNIDSCLPGHDRRMPGVDPECQWMTQQEERERNRRAMIARQERAALPDPGAIRAEAERVFLDALDGRDMSDTAREFIALCGRLARATESGANRAPIGRQDATRAPQRGE